MFEARGAEMEYSLTTVTVLKVVHVLLAATWFGASAYMNMAVMPQLTQSTPATRREFSGRLIPVGFRVGNIVGGLTLLTGVALYYVTHAGTFDATTQSDKLVMFGAIATVAVLYLLNFSMRPLQRAMEKVAAASNPNEPPSHAMTMLQGRLKFTGMLMFFLLLLTAVTMVMANTRVMG